MVNRITHRSPAARYPLVINQIGQAMILTSKPHIRRVQIANTLPFELQAQLRRGHWPLAQHSLKCIDDAR